MFNIIKGSIFRVKRAAKKENTSKHDGNQSKFIKGSRTEKNNFTIWEKKCVKTKKCLKKKEIVVWDLYMRTPSMKKINFVTIPKMKEYLEFTWFSGKENWTTK